MENKGRHLEMIQAVVNRLSTNSFLLKGWSVVLISALFALAAKDSNQLFVYLAYFPLFTFWALDGYFLWQERLFRSLYNRVRRLTEDQIDFSMDTSVVEDQRSWWAATLSKTLLLFHGTTTFVIVVIMVVMIRNGGG